MASAQTLIDRALRLIGALESGESATATETADCLTALNAMIESWQTERLVVFAYVDTAFTLSAGDGSYSVGPAGNFVLTPRPSKLENIFIRASNIDYPVQLVDQQRWYAIADKTTQADIPDTAYYEPGYAAGTILLHPIPSSSTNSLHIVTWSPVSTLAAAATTVSLPPGYERALTYNLAVELAPEFGTDAPASVHQIAAEAKAAIKRANNRPIMAYSELATLTQGGRTDIYSGGVVT